MNKKEAMDVLELKIQELRTKSYEELKNYLTPDGAMSVSAKGSSGSEYQLQIESHWDDKEGGNLRVMVSVDDGGWRAFFPLSSDFIIGPDGKFIGE